MIYNPFHRSPEIRQPAIDESTDNGNNEQSKRFKDINIVNNIDLVTKEATPPDWMVVSGLEQKITIAHPSTIISQDRVVSAGNGDLLKFISLSVGLADSDPSCTITQTFTSFDAALEKYEARDEDDDGFVGEGRYRIWSNITEKEEFLYEGVRAVRYEMYNRSSQTGEKRTFVSYFVEVLDSVYEYNCPTSTGIDEGLADRMFRQITFFR